jgi:hypothetical protein
MLSAEVKDQRRLLADLRRIAADTAGWDDAQRRRIEAQRLDVLQGAAEAMLRALTTAAEHVAAADRLLGRP